MGFISVCLLLAYSMYQPNKFTGSGDLCVNMLPYLNAGKQYNPGPCASALTKIGNSLRLRELARKDLLKWNYKSRLTSLLTSLFHKKRVLANVISCNTESKALGAKKRRNFASSAKMDGPLFRVTENGWFTHVRNVMGTKHCLGSLWKLWSGV